MGAVPYITAADVAGRLDWLRMVEALAEGHRGPRAEIGDRFLHRGPDTLLTRCAWIDGLGAAVKAVTVYPGNAARGHASVHGAMVLFEDATGGVEAVIDADLVTLWKTAADSLLGARLLARPDARRLLILGAGTVAASLVDAYRAGFPGIGIAVWNRSQTRARELAEASGVEVAGDLAEAVAGADIVATATLSSTPVLHGAWLQPGQHLDLIGAFRADMREADDAALTRARIFVDSFETTLDHIGELRDPLARGVIGRADVLGDLNDLVAGRVGRGSANEITLFKNGGGAHLDLMVGREVLAAWRAAPHTVAG
jgi:ornithine cyclodeaminase